LTLSILVSTFVASAWAVSAERVEAKDASPNGSRLVGHGLVKPRKPVDDRGRPEDVWRHVLRTARCSALLRLSIASYRRDGDKPGRTRIELAVRAVRRSVSCTLRVHPIGELATKHDLPSRLIRPFANFGLYGEGEIISRPTGYWID